MTGCRLCGAGSTESFVDLGTAPLGGRFLTADTLKTADTLYPLHVRVCPECLLVQAPVYAVGAAEAASFPPVQGERFADAMIELLDLGPDSVVVALPGSDGDLVSRFAARGVPVAAARGAGPPGRPQHEASVASPAPAASPAGAGRADLVVGVNALARAADLVGFAAGLAARVKPDGMVALEFPHLLRLVERRQVDRIDHAHHQYLSLLTASRAIAGAGLVAVEVEELSSYGGSLRVLARHRSAAGEPSSNVKSVLEAEAEAGLHTLAGHRGFAEAVFGIKRDLIEFLLAARADGRRVVGYGVGSTLLDYCGIRPDLLSYTVSSLVPAGCFLPGSRIPVFAPERIAQDRPDHVLVLPSGVRAEVAARLGHVREWGGRLVFATPSLEVV
jgi:hypothetical protein